jgi:AraC-like DNA-binding protein
MGRPLHQKAPVYNARELFGDFADIGNFAGCRDGFEASWQCPEELGAGSMYVTKLRPGLLLSIGDYRMARHLSVRFQNRYRAVMMGFIVSGEMHYTSDPWGDNRPPMHFNEGCNITAYAPEWRGIGVTPAGSPIGCVGLYVEPPLLKTLALDKHSYLPPGIGDILSGNPHGCYYHTSKTRPAVNMVVRQVLNCPYRGALKRLYYESKALELITCSVAALAAPAPTPAAKRPLPSEDAERIRHVRRVMEQEYQNPPRLLDLARSVGISHPKLNSCFRKAYGVTIFEYLREVRLNKARSLLESGRMNVTEAAFEVGYSSLSHFSKAFREHFGVSPCKFNREVCRPR